MPQFVRSGECFFVVVINYTIGREKLQDLLNIMGGMFAAVCFLGATNASAVQAVVAIERTVFYREKAAGMYSALPYAFAQVSSVVLKLSVPPYLLFEN